MAWNSHPSPAKILCHEAGAFLLYKQTRLPGHSPQLPTNERTRVGYSGLGYGLQLGHHYAKHVTATRQPQTSTRGLPSRIVTGSLSGQNRRHVHAPLGATFVRPLCVCENGMTLQLLNATPGSQGFCLRRPSSSRDSEGQLGRVQQDQWTLRRMDDQRGSAVRFARRRGCRRRQIGQGPQVPTSNLTFGESHGRVRTGKK